jgi:uncharacterized membrane protein
LTRRLGAAAGGDRRRDAAVARAERGSGVAVRGEFDGAEGPGDAPAHVIDDIAGGPLDYSGELI